MFALGTNIQGRNVLPGLIEMLIERRDVALGGHRGAVRPSASAIADGKKRDPRVPELILRGSCRRRLLIG